MSRDANESIAADGLIDELRKFTSLDDVTIYERAFPDDGRLRQAQRLGTPLVRAVSLAMICRMQAVHQYELEPDRETAHRFYEAANAAERIYFRLGSIDAHFTGIAA